MSTFVHATVWCANWVRIVDSGELIEVVGATLPEGDEYVIIEGARRDGVLHAENVYVQMRLA